MNVNACGSLSASVVQMLKALVMYAEGTGFNSRLGHPTFGELFKSLDVNQFETKLKEVMSCTYSILHR